MFAKIFCVTLLIGISSSSIITGRIVNGTDAEEGEFPYVVALRIGGIFNCGSSIISDKWLLTAAHCVVDSNPKTFSVQYGSNKLSTSGPTVARVKRVIFHNEYDPNNYYIHDVAVIELVEPIQFSEKVQPVKLPKQDYEVAEGSHAVLCGWGRDKTGGNIQTYLKKIDLTTFSNENCQRFYDHSPNNIYPGHLCAGVPDGRNRQCNGDSGGPLTVEGVQMGIVSWSVKPCGEYLLPGVYTKVSHYIDWISKQTGLQL